MDLIAAKGGQPVQRSQSEPTPNEQILTAPPELKPLSREPINLKMTNDARVVYETIAKLAGLSVIFDPDFTSRRITAELPNVTLEQALDAVSLESKAFWKPRDAERDFRGAGQAAEAQGRGRRRGPDFLSFEHADAAGPDRNRDRIAAVAGLASRVSR